MKGIEVIEPHQRPGRQALLTKAFALRHRVFVEERGWEFLRRPDGLDIDEHDESSTFHVLAVEEDRVQGHVRMVPGGYLVIATADPDRVRAAAGDASLYGLSRLCVSPSVVGGIERRAISLRLLAVGFQGVIERGCRALLFDTDPSIVFLLRSLGLAVEFVGEPAPIAGRFMQAVVLRLDTSVVSGLTLSMARWNEPAHGGDGRLADLSN